MTTNRKIKKKKLSDEVTIKFREFIASGRFAPGEKIPSERKLADEIGVSRTVIREALVKLVDQGYLRKANSYYYIKESSIETLLNIALLDFELNDDLVVDLLAVRTLLELYIASKAAERATHEDIAQMQMCIDKMKEQLTEGHLDYETETSFHYALTKAAKNRVIDSIYSLCGEILYSAGKSSFTQHRKRYHNQRS